MGASQEIRDRVIVVAIAPAAIIPKKFCYNSFNYASKKDPIPKVEFNLIYSSSLNLEYEDRVLVQKMIQDRQDELILLEPHPNAKGLDHDFRSPTVEFKLRDHIIEYSSRNGEYE